MKKCMRKLMCLTLVVLLVASMTVPAMAEPSSGNGTWEGYSFSWTVECSDTYGIAQISANGTPTYVKAYAECTIYSQEYNVYGMSYSADSLDEVPSYYVSASAMAYNSFTYQGRPETGEITKTFGSFWVKNENVVPGVNAYPE